MTKNKIVKFIDGNARIIICTDLSKIVQDEFTLVNPDLSAVKGLGPEYWQLKEGKIIPVTDKKSVPTGAKKSQYDLIIDSRLHKLESNINKILIVNAILTIGLLYLLVK
jgi:hypothetical protein